MSGQNLDYNIENRSTGQMEGKKGILKRKAQEYKNDKMAKKEFQSQKEGRKKERAEKDKGRKNNLSMGLNEKKKRDVPPYSDNSEDDVFLVPPLPYNAAAACIPIEKIIDGVIKTKDGRYVKLLEVAPTNIVYKSEWEQQKIIDRFEEFLRIAPENIHIKSVSTPMDFHEYRNFLIKHRQEEENQGCRYLDQDQIEFIEDYAGAEAVQRRFVLALECQPNRKMADKDTEFIKAAHELEAAAEDCKAFLSRCGNEVYTHENETQAVADYFYQLLNRRTSRNHPFSERLEEVFHYYMDEYGSNSVAMIPLADYVAPRKIKFFPNYVVMDGLYYTWMYVAQDSYPELVSASWTTALVNIGEGVDVDIFLTRENPEESRRRLERKMRLKSVNMTSLNPSGDNYNEEMAKLHAGAYLQMGVRNGDTIWYASILLTVVAESKEGLEWKVARLKQYARSKNMNFTRALLSQKEAFQSSLPCNRMQKELYAKASQNVLTTDLAAWYPFSSYEFSDKKGVLIGISKWNHTPVIADLFNTSMFANANVAIMGSSGSGKTYLLLTLATRLRRQHIRTILLIPEKSHEYKRTCDAIGGSFISLGPQSNHAINIFEIRKQDESVSEIIDGSLIYRSRLMEKIESLHVWLTLRIPDISEVESEAFDSACMAAYLEKGITTDNKTLIDPDQPEHYREMPTFGDVKRHLLLEEHGERIAAAFRREVEGSAQVYNQQTNVVFDNLFTVIDVSGLRRSDLLASTAYSVIDILVDIAKEDRTSPICIVFDELWAMIGMTANQNVSTQILEIFKTIRGYAGSAIYATQDVSDHDSKVGRGILAACKTKIILPLEMDEGKAAQSMLGLSDSELEYIITSPKGNALFCAGKNNIPVSVKASPLEHKLFTTDRVDLERLYHDKLARLGE